MRLLTQNDLSEMNVGPKSRAQRWRWIKAGKFPEPHQLGNRNVWRESEISAWLEAELSKKREPFRAPTRKNLQPAG